MTSEVETACLLVALVYGTWWPVVIGFFYLNSSKSIPMYFRRQALPLIRFLPTNSISCILFSFLFSCTIQKYKTWH